MTGVDFIAACFWPLVILFAILRMTVRNPVLLRWIDWVAGLFVVLCVILWAIYGQSSLIAVVDFNLSMAVLGIGLVWFGLRELHLYWPIQDSRRRAYLAIPVGVALAGVFGTMLFRDFLQSRIALEGRVQNLRAEGRRVERYRADIAGQTVTVTAPIYERLKYLPVVRVEVGRGSGYVFEIEYLAN